MSDLPAAQRVRLEEWADQAMQAGWLNAADKTSLADATTASPGQLFDYVDRPLVAGLFGGTGVGKSTLLNRLAAEPVARASAERPTSRHVTAYVHQSISVDNLPEEFPMERMRIAVHRQERYRHVLFIDMPDFDSVEASNRQLVDLWLPHLDVIVYVVSPERYRDDRGWRLLLQHATQHAWLFVMNHWDRGDPRQIEDFRQQLQRAGLDNPVIFKTDSSEQNSSGGLVEAPTRATENGDEFDQLQGKLCKLADQSIVKALEERGIIERLKQLKAYSDRWVHRIGTRDSLKTLVTRWDDFWAVTSTELQQAMRWNITMMSKQYATADGSWLKRIARRQRSEIPPVHTASLMDETLLGRIDDGIEKYLHQCVQQDGIPLAALRKAVAEPCNSLKDSLPGLMDDALKQSLQLPGTPLQRRLHKTMAMMTTVLPLVALGWIGWRVVSAFVAGGSNPAAYLGSSFAVNAGLLLAFSWLLPVLAQAGLRPSLRNAAVRGMTSGLQAAMEEVHQSIRNSLVTLASEADRLRQAYAATWEKLAVTEHSAIPGQVERLLISQIRPQSTGESGHGLVQGSSDVRATTQSSTASVPVS